MKKKILLVILLCLCIVGCGDSDNDGPVISDPVTVILSNRSGDVSNVLSEEDSAFIVPLFSSTDRYVQTAPNCLMDCYIKMGDIDIQYHSDCGNLMRMDNGMSLSLTEEEKSLVNDIFLKYMSLGIGSNEKPTDTPAAEPNEEMSGDSVTEQEPEVSKPADWKINVTLENVTPKGLTFGCLLIDSFDTEVLTGSPYFIRRLWRGEESQLETVSDAVWTMEAWIVNGGSEYKWNIDWTHLYGELKDGVYYISKSFSSNAPYSEARHSEYGAYFVIDTAGVFYKDDPWGVSMMICPGTEDVWTLVYGNDKSKGTFTVSSEYWLEVYDSAGWFKLDGFDDGWTRRETEVDGIRYENINWTSRCGKLQAGKYRIGKNVTFNGETKPYYAEFEIAEASPVLVTHYAWNLDLSVSHVTSTGLIYTLESGDSVGPTALTVDGSYGIERLENYQWVSYKMDVRNAESTDSLWVNSTVSKNVNWEDVYGQLPEGKYRFVKKVKGTVSSEGLGERVYYAEFEIGAPEVPVIDDEWGIAFDVIKATSEIITVGYMQYGGEHPDWNYYFEYPYWIERFDGESWVAVPFRKSDIAWPEPASSAINNQTNTMTVNFVPYFGNLPSGKYRIGKNVFVYNAVDSKYKDGVHLCKPYHAEFEIESDWYVTVEAEDVSALGLNLVCNVGDLPNNKTVEYNDSYTLEKLVDNAWRKVEGIDPNDFDLENVWEASENISFKLVTAWSLNGVVLSSGKYRVGKNFIYKDGDSTHPRYAYAEFEIEETNDISAELWGISLSITDVTPDGLTLYCTQSGDTPGEIIPHDGRDLVDVTVGMAFWLEQFVSGEWVKLDYLTADTVPTWTTMIGMLYADSTINWKLEWKHIYGSLPDGQYRVCKEFAAKPEGGNHYKFNAYAEFEISQSYRDPSDFGVSATAENVTAKGLDYVLKQDDSKGYYGLASKSEYSYVIERLVGGFWEEVKPLKDFYILEYATGWIPSEEKVVISIDWSEYYGDLPEGNYRISKHFYCDAYGDDVNFDVFAEFNIG